ncbi:MAG: L-aspartate--glyoxylate aminotransferase BhcA [Rubrimonas sp.]|uniref:L-aspartate--glyoxylate aminotransferase BhcA n=1 Tax=Rubrimonas sp. TaxID=2036015 RepID=UPI002FDD6F54
MSDQNPVFIPGPTNMPDRLRRAIAVGTLDHRAPDFVHVFRPVLDDLRKVFKTQDAETFIFPSTGTGGWETAVTNTLSPGDRVLAARHGMFSHRWIELCRRHHLDMQVIESDWHEGAPVARMAEALAADKAHAIKAVLATHNETATGVTSDIAAIRAALDAAKHPAMLFVDCVSSLASIDFRFDEWGVDAAVSGSQKGFMLPTGLAVLAISRKAMAAAETARCARAFFDLRDMKAANDKGGFPYTPPTQLIFGMRASLDMLFAEGLDNVFARHRRIASGVRAAIDAWGLEMVARRPEQRSDTVTAILAPPTLSADTLVSHAYSAYGVSFGVGLGEMAGKAFRIGHLGSLTDVMALSGIAAIEMAMADLGWPVRLGSGVAAAQDFYRKNNGLARKQAA